MTREGLPSINLERRTAYDAGEDPNHASYATRLLRCQRCAAMVLEYGLHVDPSAHPYGLPEKAIEIARDNDVAEVGWTCGEHEGGKAYDPDTRDVPYTSLREMDRV